MLVQDRASGEPVTRAVGRSRAGELRLRFADGSVDATVRER